MQRQSKEERKGEREGEREGGRKKRRERGREGLGLPEKGVMDLIRGHIRQMQGMHNQLCGWPVSPLCLPLCLHSRAGFPRIKKEQARESFESYV